MKKQYLLFLLIALGCATMLLFTTTQQHNNTCNSTTSNTFTDFSILSKYNL